MSSEHEDELAHWKRIAEDLTRLIETANAPLFGIDTNGNVTDWNQTTVTITGFSKEEAMGKNFADTFIHEDHRYSAQEVLANALNGIECANYELTVFTKTGERREILLNAMSRRNATGRVVGVVGIGHDITQITAIMAEHKCMADDLSRLIETANAPIFGVDVNGFVNEWNRKAAQMLGYTKEEAMGKHLVDNFIERGNQISVQEVLNKALEGVETENYALTLRSKAGKWYTVLLNATTRRDAAGRITGVVGFGQDTTDLKRVQAEKDDLARFIETANTPIFGIDADRKVSMWNAEASRLLGYNKGEVLGKPLVQTFVAEGYREPVTTVLNAALEGHDSAANFDCPIHAKTGERKELLMNATKCCGPDGEVVGVIGLGLDCTDLINIRNEQQRVADDLSRLIESANAPIFGVDLHGMVTEWNRKAEQMLGWDKGDAIGKHLVETFIEPEHRKSVMKVLNNATSGQETENYELPLIGKSGRHYTVLLNATTRRDAKGNVTGVVGVGQDISDLKTIMVESKSVADDLRALIESANAPIIGIDTEGTINEWNRKASSLLGYSRSETFRKRLIDFIDRDYKMSVSSVLSKALRGEETDNFEFPFFNKNNQRIDILLNATARRGPNGVITGVIGVGQDITELRHLSAEEKRIADDLSRLIETANAPILGVDLNGMVTEWNCRTADMLGYSKEETMGQNLVLNYIQPEYRDSITVVLQKAYTGVETANYELPLVSKNGEQYTVLLNATTRCDAKGQIIGVVGVGHDITQLKKVMSESKVLADDLSRLIATANAPIFGIDNNGNVITWNEKTVQITGFGQQEALGRPLVETFIHPAHRKSVQSVLSQALKGQETSNYELPLFTKSGERREILLNATTRRNANGDVTGVVGVGQDITELNQQKQEAIHAADDLNRLIQTANAPIFGVNTAGQVTEWNEKLATLFDIPQEEALGKSLYENFVNKECREPLSHVLLKALNGEETASFEFVLSEQNAQVLLMSSTTRRGPSGNITGVICVGQDITAMRAITAEWHEVADDLSRLIETANAPIFGVNLDGMVNEWNRKAVDLLGFEKEEAMGKKFLDYFILPHIRESVEEVLQMALSGIETANYELQVMSKTGTPFTILLNATTRRDTNGQIKGVVGVGQDISALNNAIAEATRVADDLRRLIETANAPIFGIDTMGNVTEWNNMTARISGYAKQDTMGKNLVQHFISESFKAKVSNVLELALNGHETANFEFPLYTKNGKTQVPILMNATTRRAPDGEVIGVIGVGQDITALRNAKDDADRTADELERLIESANAPIFGVNIDMKVTVWNAMIGKISGVSRAEAMGQNLVESAILDSSSRDSVARVLQSALQGTDVANFELHLRRRRYDDPPSLPGEQQDFEIAVLLLNATARVDSSGKITGVVGVGQDITEITSYKALQAQKMRFLGMVSHELRSPIHGICGLAQSLANKEKDKNRRKMLEMIQSCSGRLIDLVTNIMEFSQMKANHFKLTSGPTNLVQILDEICSLLEHATDKRGRPIKNKGVQLVNETDPAVPIIEADSPRCTQVFYNLVMNALTFTKTGIVRITSTFSADEWVQIRITDSGIGISPWHIDRIFEPFEQEGRRDGVRSDNEGIGLGLSICREIVRRHGGDISVNSEVGKGSTFAVTLPTICRIDNDSDQSPSWDKLPELRGSPGRTEQDDKQSELASEAVLPKERSPVVYVNDSPVDQEVMKQALTQRFVQDSRGGGYEVMAAYNSQEAMTTLRKSIADEQLPQIVLVDSCIQNPWDLCRSIREELEIPAWKLPIIAICAKAQSASVCIEGIKNGVTDYIMRPLSHHELRARMWTALRQRTEFISHLHDSMENLPIKPCSSKDQFQEVESGPKVEIGLSGVQLNLEKRRELRFGETSCSSSEQPLVRELSPRELSPRQANGVASLDVLTPSLGPSDPPPAKKKLPQKHTNASILVARVRGMAHIAQVLAPWQMAALLSNVLSSFDALLDAKHTQRMDRTSCSFIAVAGHNGEPRHCQRLLKLGFAFIRELQTVEVPTDVNLKLQIAIGLHTGCLYSGEVENLSTQYFGETLEVAEELERQGVPNCIHFSENCHRELFLTTSREFLPVGARLMERGDMELEDSMLIKTYLIVPARECELSLPAAPKFASHSVSLPSFHDCAVQTRQTSQESCYDSEHSTTDAAASALKAEALEPRQESVDELPDKAAVAVQFSSLPKRQTSETRSGKSMKLQEDESFWDTEQEARREHEQLERQLLQSQLIASQEHVAELRRECLKQEEAAVMHQAKLEHCLADQERLRDNFVNIETSLMQCRGELEESYHKLEHYELSLGLATRSLMSSRLHRQWARDPELDAKRD